MSDLPSRDTDCLSNRQHTGMSRRERQAIRAHSFRVATNERFLSQMEAERNARFASIALPPELVPPCEETSTSVVNTPLVVGDGRPVQLESFYPSSCSCFPLDTCTTRDEVEVPLPIHTESLQLMTNYLYDAMAREVPESTSVCSREQLHAVVQLQLLNSIHPPVLFNDGENLRPLLNVEDSVCCYDGREACLLPDVTAIKVTLPRVIEEFIYSAVPFVVDPSSVPVLTSPTGQVIKSYRKRIVMKPVIVSAHDLDGLSSFAKSRFISALDFTRGRTISSKFSPDLKCSGLSHSDAIQVMKFLKMIPDATHDAWKPGDGTAWGFPQAHYLTYGSVGWTEHGPLDLRLPPPAKIFTLLRLNGRDLHEDTLYSLFSDHRLMLSRDLRRAFGWTISRKRVQKVFHGLRATHEIDRGVFLNY